MKRILILMILLLTTLHGNVSASNEVNNSGRYIIGFYNEINNDLLSYYDIEVLKEYKK